MSIIRIKQIDTFDKEGIVSTEYKLWDILYANIVVLICMIVRLNLCISGITKNL